VVGGLRHRLLPRGRGRVTPPDALVPPQPPIPARGRSAYARTPPPNSATSRLLAGPVPPLQGPSHALTCPPASGGNLGEGNLTARGTSTSRLVNGRILASDLQACTDQKVGGSNPSPPGAAGHDTRRVRHPRRADHHQDGRAASRALASALPFGFDQLRRTHPDEASAPCSSRPARPTPPSAPATTPRRRRGARRHGARGSASIRRQSGARRRRGATSTPTAIPDMEAARSRELASGVVVREGVKASGRPLSGK